MPTPYHERRARTRRRFAAIGTIVHSLMGAAAPKYAMREDEISAELELARTGERRRNGRPAKPVNTNDAIVALLRERRPEDFKWRFTFARAEKTRLWLEGQGFHKSNDALIKLVNRAKQKK